MFRITPSMEGFCRVFALFVCLAVIREFQIEGTYTTAGGSGGRLNPLIAPGF